MTDSNPSKTQQRLEQLRREILLAQEDEAKKHKDDSSLVSELREAVLVCQRGLDEAEERELDSFDAKAAELEFRSLEITAAAISMIGLSGEEQMPSHIRERILDAGEQFVGASMEVVSAAEPSPAQEPPAPA